MIQKERAQRWREAYSPAQKDALTQDEPWPNHMYIWVDEKRFSPLGYLCYLNQPVHKMLERGGDPFASAWTNERRYRNAYQVCAHEHTGVSFSQLMSVTPAHAAQAMVDSLVVVNSGACSCRSYFRSVLMSVVERAAALAIAWALCQIQRDDLIEPVLRRLAMEEWTPAPASKKLNIFLDGFQETRK